MDLGGEMDINELKSGDVLLFSPEEGSWLSEAIVFLTGADVSHTAMTYKEFSKIIEETPPAIRVANAKERFPGRTIHVMRDERNQDFSPVMQAATKYLNEEEPYGMANLYLVGMILIYKKFSPSGPQQKATLAILKKLVSKLLAIINEHKYPGKLPMVCSQYIFQSYQDAGKDYQLTIKNGNLLNANQEKSLFEKAINQTPMHHSPIDNSLKFERPSAEISEKELLSNLKNKEGESIASLESEILEHIYILSKALHAIEQEISFESASHKAGLQVMQKQNAMFVTPADLLDHCPDLKKVGEIII